MVDAAERDRELVARLAAERHRLHVAQVMRVRRLAAADQAGLLRHKSQMVPVAIAAGGGDREHALVDAGRRLIRDTTGDGRLRRGGGVLRRLRLHPRSIIIRGRSGFGRCSGRGELQQSLFEGILHQLGIAGGEGVLGRRAPSVPSLRRHPPRL